MVNMTHVVSSITVGEKVKKIYRIQYIGKDVENARKPPIFC